MRYVRILSLLVFSGDFGAVSLLDSDASLVWSGAEWCGKHSCNCSRHVLCTRNLLLFGKCSALFKESVSCYDTLRHAAFVNHNTSSHDALRAMRVKEYIVAQSRVVARCVRLGCCGRQLQGEPAPALERRSTSGPRVSSAAPRHAVPRGQLSS